MRNISLIIDFDSTIVSAESLELLFEVALANNPEKQQIIDAVSALTNAGMNGEIPFSESLSGRIKLLPMSKSLIAQTIELLRGAISESFLSSIGELMSYDLHIISGGFKELIVPLVEPLGITSDQVHANTFTFDEDHFVGVDTTNPLAHDNGKTSVAKSLNLQPKVICIGDGFSDLQIKVSGVADQFFYYGEFVAREKIIQQADRVVPNFYEVIRELSLIDIV